MIKRVLAFVYGLIVYFLFLATFLYLIAFTENIFVPNSLDSQRQGGLAEAVLINLSLITLFGIQHSGMARQAFKDWWLKTIPAPIERSTYVLMASLMLILLFWQWQPLGGIVWQIENQTIIYIFYGISAVGWLIVLASTFLINHFDLFGLRQVYLYLTGQEYKHLEFKTVGFYNYVRHPLMLGFLIAFWATPTMTIAHLIFAVGMTVYILAAIQLEERDLLTIHGTSYEEYRQEVSMIIPFIKRSKKSSPIRSES